MNDTYESLEEGNKIGW